MKKNGYGNLELFATHINLGGKSACYDCSLMLTLDVSSVQISFHLGGLRVVLEIKMRIVM